MADTPDRAAVLALLEHVKDPRSGHGLVSAGLVQGLVVAADRVGFMLEVESGAGELYKPVAQAAEQALRARMPGLQRVQVVVTADRAPGAAPASRTVERKAAAPPAAPASMKPAHVRHVLAVASGKGGVGKSTVAVNLACAFAAQGLRAGLMDADVYGPSAPLMTGLSGHPSKRRDGKIEPLRAHGVKVMSIGFLVDEGQAMIWRGPIASGAVTQMLNDVAWGSDEDPLDVLVIDMPPGTGDIQLTLAQRVALSGAVVVSTPQEAALADVRRGLSMFDKTRTPILGVIENMAYFPDPSTGRPIAIFGRGGARATAEVLGAPFLGEIPIDQKLREACDAGAPMVVAQPGEPTAVALAGIARTVAEALERDEHLRPPPKILIER
ncbi:MAG TPA: Mrp/NBP35 family ATP-binding protein [Caulobacteraceae bacterium]|nr:Mrp/NBP35 family ATP-binding protein [Caulobacteraceae bacterium]